MKILITVKGGMVETCADSPDLDVVLIDHDVTDDEDCVRYERGQADTIVDSKTFETKVIDELDEYADKI